MEILRGTQASAGVASGRIKFINESNYQTQKNTIDNVAAEIARFNEAVEKTKEDLGILYEKTLESATEEEAEIFQIHIMMLEDGSLTDCCESIIYEQSVNAEYAVSEAAKVVSAMLIDTNDDYMMARTADIEDIKNGVLASLAGKKDKIELEDNTVIFAYDLTPSQTVNLDKSKISAFVTERGSKNSHSAILARSMKIPSVIAVTGCMQGAFEGMECIVDANEGMVCVAPDDEAKEKFLLHKKEIEEKEKYLTLSAHISMSQINMYPPCKYRWKDKH